MIATMGSGIVGGGCGGSGDVFGVGSDVGSMVGSVGNGLEVMR